MKLLQTMMLMTLTLPAFNALAADSDQDHDLCHGVAVGTLAEMRTRYYPDMSAREMDIVRKTAILACMNLYSENDNAVARQPVAAARQAQEPVSGQSREEKSSGWLDRILGNGPQQKSTTIRRRQQTGGK